MIYTVTVNPSVDYVVQLGEFHLGMVNRALNEAVFSGGKGINVAMILQNLGVSNRALGFLAGFTGDFIEKDLRRRGCRTDFVRLEKGFSRINEKLKGQEGSEINGSGPAVDQAAVQALFEKINTLQKGDILIISGSVPLSLPQDFYERILDLLKGREIDTVVDATGEALLKTLRYEPFLIKPNLQELEELAERRLFTREEIIAQGKRLQEMGAKNVLISLAAEGIIVAADKNVEMQRFYGKRVLQVSVADGIRKPEVLLGKILQGEAPVYGEGKDVEMADGREEIRGRGKKVYRDLMNGVSHMLPFVIGGGILIAVAFLLDDYSLNPANFGSNLPQAAFFKAIGDAAFGFMLPILAGYIAMGIADRPALAPGFVGGFLAKEGGSGFLGALLAGFAAGYLILLLKKLFDKLPRSLEGIKSILLYPVFGILLMGLLIQLIINPPVAWLNEALYGLLARLGTGSRVLLGVLLGGMMSVDMGGPINKAAYVFGTASLASDEFQIMAAVMAGGMVPPLALALAVFAFRDKFSEKERQSGVANLIMGACFITEGAIPFAAADPLRVLPACIIGSAVAGGLSMFFGCGLRAPHGGIFVLPVISHPFGFLAAVILGALVGMLLLGVLRKRIEPSES